VPEQPPRDGYVTATGCPLCDTPLTGRTDQRYCGSACRQVAYRPRTSTTAPPPSPLPAMGRTRRQQTVYECGECSPATKGAPTANDPPDAPACGDPIIIPTSPRRSCPNLPTPDHVVTASHTTTLDSTHVLVGGTCRCGLLE